MAIQILSAVIGVVLVVVIYFVLGIRPAGYALMMVMMLIGKGVIASVFGTPLNNKQAALFGVLGLIGVGFVVAVETATSVWPVFLLPVLALLAPIGAVLAKRWSKDKKE